MTFSSSSDSILKVRSKRILHSQLFLGLVKEWMRVYIDREELTLVVPQDTDDDQRMRSSPERFIAVQQIPPQTVLEASLPSLREIVDEPTLESLRSCGSTWWAAAEKILPKDVLTNVKTVTTRYIIELGEKWLRSQGLPIEPFTRPSGGRAESINEFSSPQIAISSPAEPHGKIPVSSAIWVKDPELFRAFVRNSTSEAPFLDLSSRKVIWAMLEGESFASPVRDAEYQYVQIPTIPSHEQQAFALDFYGSGLSDSQKDRIIAAGPGWMDPLREMVSALAWKRFDKAYATWVASKARDWLEAHRFEVSRFISPFNPQAKAASDSGRQSIGQGELREMLHEAIDLLNDNEIGQILIPARVLLLLRSSVG